MATLAELRAEAKRQKRKGYSKLKKAELEKLLDTPPPKPPRGVPRKKPAPAPKIDKDNVKIPYKQVARKKDSDGIQIISVPLSLILTILEVEEGVKTIYVDDPDYQKDMTRISRSLKRQFLKQYDNSYAEKTTNEWEKIWNKFTNEEYEKAKKDHKKKFGKMDYLH